MGVSRRRNQLTLRRSGAFGAGALVGRGIRKAWSGSRTTTGSRKMSAPAPITGESDYRSVYRRKRMPFRRRKRWVKFTRRVKSVISKGIAPSFNVRISTTTMSSASGKQDCSSIMTVMGSNGSDPHSNDLLFLANIAVANFPQTGPGVVSSPSNFQIRYVISGWMCEAMLTNNQTYSVFVDMYYWRCKKDTPTTLPSVTDVWDESLADLRPNQTAGVAINTITKDDYGVTPFQGTQFAKHIQIWKKTRVKLAGGSVTQVELRGAKDTVINYGYAEQFSLLRGKSQGIFFVSYGTPDPTDTVARPASISVAVNKNYTWKNIWDSRQQGMTSNV